MAVFLVDLVLAEMDDFLFAWEAVCGSFGAFGGCISVSHGAKLLYSASAILQHRIDEEPPWNLDLKPPPEVYPLTASASIMREA